MVVIVTKGVEIEEQEILDFYKGKVASFCIPDAVEFAEELPHTATGKLSKKDLRSHYKDKILG
jgi:fatty-acyl-CoA synthase